MAGAGTQRAPPGAMHVLLFSLKRTFHTTHWAARRLLSPFELTPSRLDMLFAITRRALQSEVREMLGVTRATVSRMIRSLEKLGFVTRERHPRDKRQLVVRLTEWGARRLHRVIDRFETRSVAHRLFRRLLSGRPWGHGPFRTKSELYNAAQTVEFEFEKVRQTLNDTAARLYPWPVRALGR